MMGLTWFPAHYPVELLLHPFPVHEKLGPYAGQVIRGAVFKVSLSIDRPGDPLVERGELVEPRL